MAQPIAMPRSGVWMLRSKSDRRWNFQGQYSSSDWWNPSESSWPPEAIDALAQLRGSLGGNPPEDLSCVFLPYPRPQLKRLFESNLLMATETQGALHCLTQERGLSLLGLDREKGEAWFGTPRHEPACRFPAQFLGALDEGNSFWWWGWTAEGTGALNPSVLSAARMLREYGTKHEVPELTYEHIALGIGDDRPWFNAGYLMKIACRLCDADFAIAGGCEERPNLKEIWLVMAPGILPQPESVSKRMFFVIKEAIESWGPDLGGSQARQAVETYARQRNCTVSDWTDREMEGVSQKQPAGGRRMRIDDASGDCIFIDFDESGDIAGMGYPPPRVPQAPRPSWLKRLLGGGG
jgi:hypothetical protein